LKSLSSLMVIPSMISTSGPMGQIGLKDGLPGISLMKVRSIEGIRGLYAVLVGLDTSS